VIELPARLATALADRYRIERELGAGGMATVYLAHDVKHDRKVALKVLKPELAAVLGAERFVHEIKTTASLQHPHILPLFDSGEAEGFLFYVMPYIEGETLRDKLNRETQLGIEEAIKITTEVADALDYAHRNNVIHRDIKPENILLHDGRPMMMDFGIALAVSAAAGGRMTETGLSLGTPHYMSPEQATADKTITARSDVYSLASVLYEMLTGSPPHLGGSAQQIIMKIIAEPVAPVTTLRRNVPPNVTGALAKALEKLPADRFESAAQFAEALGNPHYRGTVALTGDARSREKTTKVEWNRLTSGMAAAALVFAVVAGWAVVTRPVVPVRQVLRATILLPDSVRLGVPTFGSRVAISPDGARIVFVGYGGGGRQLWMRSRDRLDAVRIPGTDGAHAPFFSPDGERLGFITLGPPTLKAVSIADGLVHVLADSGLGADDSNQRAAAAWGMDGSIYVASLDGVLRIPQDGGRWTLVSHNDTSAHENGHNPTDVLPNGRGLLFTIAHVPNTMASLYDVAALDLRSGKHQVLTRGVAARYVAPGYVVVVRADGVVIAAPFDQDRLTLTGPFVTLTSGADAGGGVRDIAVTADGTLLHTERATGDEASELVWVRRDGTMTSLDPSWRANFESVAISPDGKRLAVGIITRDGAEVWIKQLPTGPHYRFSTDGPINYRPTWVPGGGRVAFRAMNLATGKFDLVARRADGIGPTELLASETRSIATGFVSPDGQWRIYRTDATEGGRGDILGLGVGDSVAKPLVATPAEERHPSLSPNGRWLAYRSDEGGTHDVWVRPFPNVADGKWQVSAGGGTEPVWSRSGTELFYITPENQMVAATVSPDSPFVVRERRVLFTRPPTVGLNISTAAYDISPDDELFLMIRSRESAPGGDGRRDH
jgi:serine/threonine-protein kinase